MSVTIVTKLTWSSVTFLSLSGNRSAIRRTSSDWDNSNQSSGISEESKFSSPIIVTLGKRFFRDAIMHLSADLSASVCKSFLPFEKKKKI